MTSVLCSIYIIIGSALVLQHAEDILAEVPDPTDVASIAYTGFKWIITWPWWVFKR